MKTGYFFVICTILFTAFSANSQTAFTYQGRLIDHGVRANGNYDLSFSLYDAATDGNLVGTPITNTAVSVSNGLFTTSLDFGASAFTNGFRWLEISEGTNGSENFTLLTPRQALTAAPYAVVAGTLSGQISAAQLNGTIADGQLSTNVALLNGSANFAGTVSAAGGFVGDGSGVTNIALSGLDSHGGLATLTNRQPFTLSATLAVSNGPTFVVIADVNGDGKPDLINANFNDDDVTVLTNNGDGTFTFSGAYAVGAAPSSVSAVDLNGDGKIDLVTADEYSDTVTVLTNNGDGTFTPGSTNTVGYYPYSVTVADVNNDGIPDLISADSQYINPYSFPDSSLTVLIGNGDGTFQTGVPYAVDSGPLRAMALDVNHDGWLDLVSINEFSSTINVLTNNGDGTFTFSSAVAVGQEPLWMTAADLNGDSELELITANAFDHTLTVLTNDGSGGFTVASTLAAPGANNDNEPVFVLATNLFGETLPDLVTVNEASGSLTILTNDGTGIFGFDAIQAVGTGPAMVAAKDLDGDGKLELVVANYDDNTLSVLTNSPGKLTYTAQLSGNGAGLTGLNASALTAGTISNNRLSLDVALAEADQAFTGQNAFVNANNFFNGTFFGSFIGDGSQLSGVTVAATNVTGAFSWQTITGASQQAEPNIGYILLNSSLTTVTLPTSANIGDIVRISGVGTGGWQIAQQAGQSILGAGVVGGVHPSVWSLPAGSPNAQWTAIASSADGTKLVAGGYASQIYTSTDSGVTWTAQFGDGSEDWTSIASSADGTKLVAMNYFGTDIYTSTDSGTNWTAQPAGDSDWQSVASSADGTQLVAVTYGSGKIYTSTDSGVTWTFQFGDGSQPWSSVASSADGTKLVAVDTIGQIYTSTDSGTNWAVQFDDEVQNWTSVASSSDGTELVASSYLGSIYTSTDSGANWTDQFGNGQAWFSVASSSDGTKLFAMAANDSIYNSTDSGVTWTAQFGDGSQNWFSVAASADGSKAAAVANGGQIYAFAPGSATATTTGTGGYLQGGQNTSIELLYIGNNQFLPISHEGTINAN